MQMEITRDVVSDLWPLVEGGEASPDSRALVERYLASDREFSETLRRSAALGTAVPQVRLSSEAERRLLELARERTRNWVLLAALAIGVFGVIVLAVLGGALFVMANRF
jgi:ferric-dicitrate binding protein FerR (iron transport regulator)